MRGESDDGIEAGLEPETIIPEPVKAPDSRHGFGVACILASAIFTSTAGILVRWVEEAGGWQILFYRSVSFVIVLLVFLVFRHRSRVGTAFMAVGRPGLVVAAALGISFIAFIFALIETTVANAVFIVSASPVFAALLGWLVLREPVRSLVWAAMAATLVGIGVMVADGLAVGGLDGNLFALLACVCYASTLVAIRRGKAVDMLPAVCLAGVFAALVSAAVAPDLRIGAHDLAIAVTLGIVQLGFQYILLTTGSRHVPAAEIALLTRIAAVLGPLWVWIGVGEVPSELTFIGGAIVLTAVIGLAVRGLVSARDIKDHQSG